MTGYVDERVAGQAVPAAEEPRGEKRELPIGLMFVTAVLALYAVVGVAVYLAVHALFV